MARRRRVTSDIPELQGLTYQQAAFVVEMSKDFDHQRAAEAVWSDPSKGVQQIKLPEIRWALDLILSRRMQESDIDAQWLLYEAVDNHLLARQRNNLSASNKALELIGKMSLVDAFAAEKIDLRATEEVADRLIRGRLRAREKTAAASGDTLTDTDQPPVSFI